MTTWTISISWTQWTTRTTTYLLSLILASAVVSCGSDDASIEPAGPAIEVDTHVVRLDAADGEHEVSGTLKAEHTAVVTSRIPGYVRELRVQAGESVRSGQTLAVLAGEEMQARLAAAKSGLIEAEQAEIEASSGLVAVESRARLARSTYDRFKQLEAERAVTEQEMDEVASQHFGSEAEKAAAEARLSRVAASLERARAEVAAAEAVWEYTNVRAPFHGRVIERRVDIGNLAMPGTPLFVIEQDGPLTAEVALDESLSGEIAVGAEVTVSLEGADSGDPLLGTVVEVAPAVDPRSRAFVVKVALPAEIQAERYAPGRFVRVRFRVGTVERLLVPETSIVRRGQLESVYVVQDERARMRLVTLGRVRGGMVEVLSGLDGGETIVRQADDVSQDGARVSASS